MNDQPEPSALDRARQELDSLARWRRERDSAHGPRPAEERAAVERAQMWAVIACAENLARSNELVAELTEKVGELTDVGVIAAGHLERALPVPAVDLVDATIVDDESIDTPADNFGPLEADDGTSDQGCCLAIELDGEHAQDCPRFGVPT